MNSRHSRLRRFVGRETFRYGLVGILVGLLLFAVDLALAMTLQRFFFATGLLASLDPRLALFPLLSPLGEAALLVLAGGIRVSMQWLSGYVTGLCHVAFESKSRDEIARWAIARGQAPVGSVMTLYNDTTVGSAAAISNAFYLTGRCMMSCATLLALLYYLPLVTCIVLLSLVLVFPIHKLIDARIMSASNQTQRALADSIDGLASGVKNYLFFRIHGLGRAQIDTVAAATERYRAQSNRYYGLSSLRASLPQYVGLAVVAAVTLVQADESQGGNGALLAYLFLLLRFFQNLGDIARVTGNLMLNLPRVRLAWRWWNGQIRDERFAELDADAAPVRSGDLLGWQGAGLAFQWPDASAPIFSDLSIDIEPGKLTLVSGASGSGKSTLLLLLAGVLAPTAGSLRTYDRIGAIEAGLAARLAYVGPDPFTIAGSIRDQLVLGLAREPSAAEIDAALACAQCDFVAPLGLAHRVSEQGAGLSAGQKQRLALARALLRRPDALLLDEPTANLDAKTEQSLVATIAQMRGAVTIVIISHSRAFDGVADRHVLLGEGTA
ncbi:MAG: ABC transporter ATP-binding protein/permease [Magnetospirillum sp.]|nr:ABC transporter ATP-binding protein/permease [Magnetospirillum sp.]